MRYAAFKQLSHCMPMLMFTLDRYMLSVKANFANFQLFTVFDVKCAQSISSLSTLTVMLRVTRNEYDLTLVIVVMPPHIMTFFYFV